MIAPPDKMIEIAVAAGARSPCAKSKRGAVIFDPRGKASILACPDGFVSAARNHPPFGFTCDGSDACRASCPKICLHAEADAITAAVAKWGGDMSVLELVHVKVVDGKLVAGGAPSCWQCSRLVADAGISVWLYETNPHEFREATHCPTTRVLFKDCGFCTGQFCANHDGGCECATDQRHEGVGPAPAAVWRRYTAAEFHIATSKHERNMLHLVRV